MRSRFGDAILETSIDRKQAIAVVEPAAAREIAEWFRDEEQFDMLADLTAVDWPKRERRFDVVRNLYSLAKNERLRLKAHVGEERARAERRARVAGGGLDGARMFRPLRDCV